eukprot:2047605-Rhodomonas_salina.2
MRRPVRAYRLGQYRTRCWDHRGFATREDNATQSAGRNMMVWYKTLAAAYPLSVPDAAQRVRRTIGTRYPITTDKIATLRSAWRRDWPSPSVWSIRKKRACKRAETARISARNRAETARISAKPRSGRDRFHFAQIWVIIISQDWSYFRRNRVRWDRVSAKVLKAGPGTA